MKTVIYLLMAVAGVFGIAFLFDRKKLAAASADCAACHKEMQTMRFSSQQAMDAYCAQRCAAAKNKTQWDIDWERGTEERVVGEITAGGKKFVNVTIKNIGGGIPGTDVFDESVGLAADGTRLRTQQMWSSAPRWIITQ